jgi:hypothetical protein
VTIEDQHEGSHGRLGRPTAVHDSSCENALSG